MTEENHAKEQAKAQYESICEMLAALDCDYDRLGELKEECDALQGTVDDTAGESSEYEEALREQDTWCDEFGAEYEELQAAAGDCEILTDAEERIQEDPLSVQVRSGWYYPGSYDGEPTSEEFEILLCTGGSAVRITGELDENSMPSRAWLEYQDWGTPWTRYFDAEQDVLVRYSSQFYFGS